MRRRHVHPAHLDLNENGMPFNTVGYAEKHFPNFVKLNNRGRKYVNEERFPNTVGAELAAQGLKAATEDPAVGDRVVYAPLDGISVWATVQSPVLEYIDIEHHVNGHRFVERGHVYTLRTDDGRVIRPFKEDMKYDWDMYVPLLDRLSLLARLAATHAPMPNRLSVLAKATRSRSRSRSRSRNRRKTRNNKNA